MHAEESRARRFCSDVGTCLAVLVMGLATAISAFAVGSTLLAAFQATPTGEVEISLEQPERRLWILAAEANGRALKADDVTMVGEWKVESGLPGDKFLHDAGRGAASLKLPAASWVWIDSASDCGTLLVKRNGETIKTIDLHADESFFSWESLAPAGSSWWVAALVFAALATLLWRLRPWRDQRWAGLWLVLVTGLCSISYWLQTPIGVVGDAMGYLASYESLVERGAPAYFPVGFGFFLEACRSLSPSNAGHLAALLQHAMIVHAAWMAFALMTRYIGLVGAWFAAAVMAMHPWTIMTAQALLPETMTFYVLALALYFLASGRGRIRALCAGIATGVGVALRMVPGPVIVPVIAALCLMPRSRRDWPRFVLACVGICFAPMSLLVYYGSQSGDARLSTGFGRHIYNHVVVAQRLVDEDGELTKRVLEKLDGRDIRELPHWELDKALGPAFGPLGGESIYMGLTREAASTASLLEHVDFTLDLTWRNLVGDSATWIPRTTEVNVNIPDFTGAAIVAPAQLRVFMESAMPWFREHAEFMIRALCVVLLIGLLRRTTRWTVLILLWVPLSYVLISSAVEYESPRYKIAVLPFLTLALAMTPAVLFRWGSLQGAAEEQEEEEDQDVDDGKAESESVDAPTEASAEPLS